MVIETAWFAPATYTVSQIVTAANLNTYLRDNMIDLDRRTTSSSAIVATVQTTSSTTYVDLATVGPAVTVTIGSTGLANIGLYDAQNNNTAAAVTFTSFAISGANTLAASDSFSLAYTSPVGGAGIRFGYNLPISGMVAGATTFTSKYHVNTNTGTWQDRQIILTPLGS